MSGRDHLFTSAAGVRHYLDDRGCAPGEFVIQSYQDVDHILEHNKAQATHNDGYTPSRDLRRVATIPASVRMKWLLEEGWDCFKPECADKLKAKLNSSEYLYLRTAPGRV